MERTARHRNAIKDEEFRVMCEQWRTQLERPNTPGEFTKLAILPRLEGWLTHKAGGITFHITQ